MALCLPQATQAKVNHLLPKPQKVEISGGNAFALGRPVTITDPTDCALLQEFFTNNGCTIAEGGTPVRVTIVNSIEGSYDYALYGFENEASRSFSAPPVPVFLHTPLQAAPVSVRRG